MNFRSRGSVLGISLRIELLAWTFLQLFCLSTDGDTLPRLSLEPRALVVFSSRERVVLSCNARNIIRADSTLYWLINGERVDTASGSSNHDTHNLERASSRNGKEISGSPADRNIPRNIIEKLPSTVWPEFSEDDNYDSLGDDEEYYDYYDNDDDNDDDDNGMTRQLVLTGNHLSDVTVCQCVLQHGRDHVMSNVARIRKYDLEMRSDFQMVNKTVLALNKAVIDCGLFGSDGSGSDSGSDGSGSGGDNGLNDDSQLWAELQDRIQIAYYHNGSLVQMSDRYHISRYGSLHISDVTWSDAGLYQCSLSFRQSSSSSSNFSSSSNSFSSPVSKSLPSASKSPSPKPTAAKFFPLPSSSSQSLPSLVSAGIVASNANQNQREDSGERVGWRTLEAEEGGRGTQHLEFKLLETYLTVTSSVSRSTARLTQKPRSLTRARAGAAVELECAAEGWPIPKISWVRGGGLGLPEGRYRLVMGNLLIEDVRLEDEGPYTCSAENRRGHPVTSHTLLQILDAPVLLGSSTEEEKVRVSEGAPLTLNCTTTDSPASSVVWYHNAKPITSSTGASDTAEAQQQSNNRPVQSGSHSSGGSDESGVKQSNDRRGQSNPGGSDSDKVKPVWKPASRIANENTASVNSLNIEKVTRKSAGVYQCFAENAAGTAHRTFNVVVSNIPALWPTSTTTSSIYRAVTSRNPVTTPISTGYLTDDESHQELEERTDEHDIDNIVLSVHDDLGLSSRNRKAAGRGLPSRPIVAAGPTSTSVRVDWTIEQDVGGANDSGSVVALGVQVKADIEGGSKSRWVTVVEDIPSVARFYIIHDIQHGTTYQFRITAIYEDGERRHSRSSRRFSLAGDDYEIFSESQSPLYHPAPPHLNANDSLADDNDDSYYNEIQKRPPPIISTTASNELLFLVLGCVFGTMLLILISVMMTCALKQRRRERILSALDGRSKFHDSARTIHLSRVSGRLRPGSYSGTDSGRFLLSSIPSGEAESNGKKPRPPPATDPWESRLKGDSSPMTHQPEQQQQLLLQQHHFQPQLQPMQLAAEQLQMSEKLLESQLPQSSEPIMVGEEKIIALTASPPNHLHLTRLSIPVSAAAPGPSTDGAPVPKVSEDFVSYRPPLNPPRPAAGSAATTPTLGVREGDSSPCYPKSSLTGRSARSHDRYPSNGRTAAERSSPGTTLSRALDLSPDHIPRMYECQQFYRSPDHSLRSRDRSCGSRASRAEGKPRGGANGLSGRSSELSLSSSSQVSGPPRRVRGREGKQDASEPDISVSDEPQRSRNMSGVGAIKNMGATDDVSSARANEPLGATAEIGANKNVGAISAVDALVTDLGGVVGAACIPGSNSGPRADLGASIGPIMSSINSQDLLNDSLPLVTSSLIHSSSLDKEPSQSETQTTHSTSPSLAQTLRSLEDLEQESDSLNTELRLDSSVDELKFADE